jgi:hypothetical protein
METRHLQSNPKIPIGHTSVGKCGKEFARVCKFDNWEQCTNQGNRAFGITIIVGTEIVDNGLSIPLSTSMAHARHSSMDTHKRYMRQNDDAHAKLQKALAGTKDIPHNAVGRAKTDQCETETAQDDTKAPVAPKQVSSESAYDDDYKSLKRTYDEIVVACLIFVDDRNKLLPNIQELLNIAKHQLEHGTAASILGRKMIGFIQIHHVFHLDLF